MTVGRARLVIGVAVLTVFGRLLACDFTWWDDWVTVHQNEAFRPVTAGTFERIWTTPRASIYVPLTYTLWAVVAAAAAVPPDPMGIAFDPVPFHAVNLLTHLGGAMAAFALLRRLLRATAGPPTPAPAVPTIGDAGDPTIVPALLGALVWAVHPVQVESVGWVSGLKDVLGGTLVLCTMLLYVRWRQDGGRWAYAAAAGVYGLALLAKPSAFTTPLILVAFDRLLFGVPWRRVIVAMTPLAVLTLPVAVVARLAQPATAADAPLWARPLLAGDALAFYAAKTVLPLRLAIDYGRNVPWLQATGTFYVAWLLPAAVAAGVVWAYRRARRAGRPLSPLPAIGLLVFVLAPLHVLGLVRFEFQVISNVADHYQYVAVFGAGVLVAWLVRRRPRCTAAATAAVVLLGARAAWQTPVWQDEDRLMRHTLSVNPRSWTAYTNLSAMASKRREPGPEADYLARAEAIRPDDPTVLLGRLDLCVRRGRVDEAHAYARRLIEASDRHYRTPAGGAGQPYRKVMDRFINAGRPDDAGRYLDALARVDPRDPLLGRYAERLRRLRDAAARP